MNYIEKENIIDNLIEKNEYKEAIEVLAGLIELTNAEIAKNKFDKHIKPNLYNVMEEYRLLNFKLYEIMMDINYIYEEISNVKKIDKNFVTQLRDKYNELKMYNKGLGDVP